MHGRRPRGLPPHTRQPVLAPPSGPSPRPGPRQPPGCAAGTAREWACTARALHWLPAPHTVSSGLTRVGDLLLRPHSRAGACHVGLRAPLATPPLWTWASSCVSAPASRSVGEEPRVALLWDLPAVSDFLRNLRTISHGGCTASHFANGTQAVSYTHLTLPTTGSLCRSRWSPYH